MSVLTKEEKARISEISKRWADNGRDLSILTDEEDEFLRNICIKIIKALPDES